MIRVHIRLTGTLKVDELDAIARRIRDAISPELIVEFDPAQKSSNAKYRRGSIAYGQLIAHELKPSISN